MRDTLTRAWRSLRRFVGWVPPRTSIAAAQTRREAFIREWTGCRMCIWWRECRVHRRGQCPGF